MKKLFHSVKFLSILAVICIVLGAGTIVYASVLFTAHSSVDGTIKVNPYIPPSSSPPSASYSSIATNASFNETFTADSDHTATISISNLAVTITDTSTNGQLTGIQGYDMSGTLPGSLAITSNDTFPVLFSDRTATLHFTLAGIIGEGTWDLASGSPVINLDCY